MPRFTGWSCLGNVKADILSALKQALAGLKATYDVRVDPGSHEVILVIRLEKQ
jgi:hypothetical protein